MPISLEALDRLLTDGDDDQYCEYQFIPPANDVVPITFTPQPPSELTAQHTRSGRRVSHSSDYCYGGAILGTIY